MFEQFGPIGCNIKHNSVDGSGQGESASQENGQDDVGEDCCEVDGFAEALDALDQSHEDDDPGDGQADHQLASQGSGLVDRSRNLEHSIAEKARNLIYT